MATVNLVVAERTVKAIRAAFAVLELTLDYEQPTSGPYIPGEIVELVQTLYHDLASHAVQEITNRVTSRDYVDKT